MNQHIKSYNVNCDWCGQFKFKFIYGFQLNLCWNKIPQFGCVWKKLSIKFLLFKKYFKHDFGSVCASHILIWDKTALKLCQDIVS